MTRIVVTGFEPWREFTENPTLAVLDGLERESDLPGELTTLRLPVDTTALADMTEEALLRVKPDIWISLGLDAGLAVIAIERIAANVRDFPHPDGVGHQPAGETVFPGGPDGRMATLPIKSIARALRETGIPAKISNSPSTYLCNQLMYTVLHLIDRHGLATRAGFMHVPVSPAHVAQQAFPFVEMPSMSVPLMTRAISQAIRTTVASEHDEPVPAFNY